MERKEKRTSVAHAGAENKHESAPTGRRERNKQEKLARIVEAAKELFGTKGFAETTTQEIAEKADIGTGTLFLYAKSKEDLLVMVFKDEMIATSQAAFGKQPAGSSLIDQLMHVFDTMIVYHAQDLDLAKALIREITVPPENSSRRSDLQALMQVIYGGIADLVIAGQKTGKLRQDIDPLLVAESFFAIYYIGLLGWLGGLATRRQFINRLRPRLECAIEGIVAH
ncbi:TetR family transcriptional regulator [Parvibaculum sedimenti]|uniref:TetR family transcriptional regulator n=1 Tax=Parvibaculum sedimenti TaxID=2608632 RepID=A0A6N6VK08_9HYPH|nr:TetR family transcriptional regulator [Parvibaculum sedimenti]